MPDLFRLAEPFDYPAGSSIDLGYRDRARTCDAGDSAGIAELSCDTWNVGEN
jgi:hypothetical protein